MGNINMMRTLCRFAWDYPVINISRSEIRNCCRAEQNRITQDDIDKHGLKLFTEFGPLAQVKRDLLNGVKTPACKSCWRIEEAGGVSPRHGFEGFVTFLAGCNWFGTTDAGEIKKRLVTMSEQEVEALATQLSAPRMVEISLSTVCDLKCLYCNHHYSSQWAAEKLKFKDIPVHILSEELPKPNASFEGLFWEWFSTHAYRTTRSVNFIGGEPLLIDEFYEYMDKIIPLYARPDAPDQVTFSVVTNFNTPPKQFKRFLDMLPNLWALPNVHLDLSVSAEALNERAEFIRNGCNWETVSSNVNAFLEAVRDVPKPRCTFGFITSLNALCITGLPDFLQFAADLRRRYEDVRPIHLRKNQIVYPNSMSPVILPPHYAGHVRAARAIVAAEKINEFWYIPAGKWTAYGHYLEGLARMIENPEKDLKARQEFKQLILQMKERRGLDFYATFPEMTPFFESIP